MIEQFVLIWEFRDESERVYGPFASEREAWEFAGSIPEGYDAPGQGMAQEVVPLRSPEKWLDA